MVRKKRKIEVYKILSENPKNRQTKDRYKEKEQ
jgi:hypothetical protein